MLGNLLNVHFSRWVNQCPGEENVFHDTNRRTLDFPYAGQNYASKTHSAVLGDKFLSDMIQGWYDEVIVQKYVCK